VAIGSSQGKESPRSRIGGFNLLRILTAFITSLARISLGTDQAQSSRYQSYALLFWLAIGIWLMIIASARQMKWALSILLACIATNLAASPLRYRRIVELVQEKTAQRELGGVALITGVHDYRPLETALYHHPPFMWKAAQYLRTHRLPIFAGARFMELGAR
jgi:hypothetical protein